MAHLGIPNNVSFNPMAGHIYLVGMGKNLTILGLTGFVSLNFLAGFASLTWIGENLAYLDLSLNPMAGLRYAAG